jgi:BirA family biotin operon repressor/biotin-[acetyl-CoA-carboxylase] ligase
MVMTTTSCDLLSVDRMRRHLRTDRFGQHIYLFGPVTSTNAVLRRLAAHGAGEGTVVLAEEQSEGRGRQGVRWFSPGGVNLYCSVLLRPALAPSDVPIFAVIASLALADALRLEGVDAGLKWPNDVLAGGRKVGGARVEYTTLGDRVARVIAGIGANLNVDRDALDVALGAEAAAATSVLELTGRVIDRNVFAAELLNRLEAWYATWEAQGRRGVIRAWRERDALCGRLVEVRSQAGPWLARACGIDDDGALLVQAGADPPRRVLADPVRLATDTTQEVA